MSDMWSHSHDWDLGYAKGHKDGYEQGRADAIKDFADWLVKYKVISDSAMHELIRDFNGEMNND